MKYCCHLLAGTQKTDQFLDRVEKRVKLMFGGQFVKELLRLSVKRDEASLSVFYRYFFDKCSSAISENVPEPRANSMTWYYLKIERRASLFGQLSFRNQLPSSCSPAQFERRMNKFEGQVIWFPYSVLFFFHLFNK